MKLPKLHIRDLFWLMLVAGIVCGWWLAHVAHVASERESAEALAEAKAEAVKVADGLKAQLQDEEKWREIITTRKEYMRARNIPVCQVHGKRLSFDSRWQFVFDKRIRDFPNAKWGHALVAPEDGQNGAWYCLYCEQERQATEAK